MSQSSPDLPDGVDPFGVPSERGGRQAFILLLAVVIALLGLTFTLGWVVFHHLTVLSHPASCRRVVNCPFLWALSRVIWRLRATSEAPDPAFGKQFPIAGCGALRRMRSGRAERSGELPRIRWADDDESAEQPDGEHRDAGDHGADRQAHHQNRTRHDADHVERSRPAALLGRLGEGRGVGDPVVDQDAERREADDAAQVGGQHQEADDHARLAASAWCGVRYVGCTAASQAGQVTVAGHRERGPADARRSGRAGVPRLATAPPTRTTGASPPAPTACTALVSGATASAEPAGPQRGQRADAPPRRTRRR